LSRASRVSTYFPAGFEETWAFVSVRLSPSGVEAGHEFAVGGAGGGEVLVAFSQLLA
jgi:hypothetical protein